MRRSFREDGKVKNETLGNLSHLSEPLIDLIRRLLPGETFVPLHQAFEIVGSRSHGAVQAVAAAMQRLGFASLLATRTSLERDLVCAMIAARIITPHTKQANTRWWHTTTLAEDFGVADATEDELHAAMDWLLTRQGRLQKKLAYICRKTAWCCTTCRPVILRARPAHWPNAATAETGWQQPMQPCPARAVADWASL